MSQRPTGPACGNNPNYRMSDGDRQAVEDFKAYLAARALRDRIAALFRHPPGEERLGDATPGEIADAVLAVLPAPVDRAAVLNEAADHLARQADELWAPGTRAHTVMQADVAELRRMAAEAQPTPDLAAADNPTQLRWGLNDVLWGDDDTVTVLLSGPGGEPYWLELDPERAAVLREDLAGPEAQPTQPQPQLGEDLPARLEAVLTKRYTELGNQFAEMRRREQGPDGWPASHPVGPHHVAETLRELLADAEPQQDEAVHACPPDGSGLTPCCGRTPFELPRRDRISSEAPTTCPGVRNKEA